MYFFTDNIMDNTFANDIKKGLSAKRKFIPDRDYYDDKGSVYFQELMAHPDYYVTDAEFEILQKYKTDIVNIFSDKNSINLIEFGAGDGYKTKILLKELLSKDIDFKYIPIDISKKYIKELNESIKKELPGVNVEGMVMDYFDALQVISNRGENAKNAILFLGSSFGGLNKNEAYDFLGKIHKLMNNGDLLLFGFDLKKSPDILHKAYHSTCKDWCKYLLQRINNELSGNFNINKFEYYTTYNPVKGKFEWYFLSKEIQDVYIKDIDLKVHFDLYESIFIGQSKKFSLYEIKYLANKFNFKIEKSFYDSNMYFSNVIYKK